MHNNFLVCILFHANIDEKERSSDEFKSKGRINQLVAELSLKNRVLKKSLQDFSQLIKNLPLEEQQDLLHLLIKDITVYSYNPTNEEVQKLITKTNEKILKMRTQYYKIKIRLHQIIDITGTYKKKNRVRKLTRLSGADGT